MSKHLVLIALSWGIILIAWSLFCWLAGASWVGPAIIALLMPVVLLIATVPWLLTWLLDRLNRKAPSDPS